MVFPSSCDKSSYEPPANKNSTALVSRHLSDDGRPPFSRLRLTPAVSKIALYQFCASLIADSFLTLVSQKKYPGLRWCIRNSSATSWGNSVVTLTPVFVRLNTSESSH